MEHERAPEVVAPRGAAGLEESRRRLALVGVDLGVALVAHDGEIVTVGERAEDVFYIADADDRPLDRGVRARVEQSLTSALDRRP